MKPTSPGDMVTRLLMTAIAAMMLCLCLAAPSHARFLQPDNWDPWLAGVDINRYAYGNNDPVNRSDPNGHDSCGEDSDCDGDPDFMDRYPGIPDDTILESNPMRKLGIIGSGPYPGGGGGRVVVGPAAGKSLSSFAKKVPNPGGKLGDATTRAKTVELVKEINARGNRADVEVRVKISNGFKRVRFVDVVEYRTDGSVVHHQIGIVNKNGLPVIRERRAISDIEGATGAKVKFHNKFDPPQQNSGGGSGGSSGGSKTGSGSKGGFIDTLKSLFGF